MKPYKKRRLYETIFWRCSSDGLARLPPGKTITNVTDDELLKSIEPHISTHGPELQKQIQQKHDCLRAINHHLNENFLFADQAYATHCKRLITKEEYESQKLSFVKSWVKTHTHSDIDNEQAQAIAAHGIHTQAIARAGSGKTTTIVNRAIFLHKHCGVPPNQIMLLAFNRKAAEEIKERLQPYFETRTPHVMTFHALAYAIVHPEEALLYDDPTNQTLTKSQALQSTIDDFLRHPQHKDTIRKLMLSHFRSDWERLVSGGHTLKKHDFLKYRRSLPNVSLRGEHLKSHGEKLIADFLFEHDIPYKYEKHFWWGNINYRPDFTIFRSSDSGIIIEYLGMAGEPDYDEQIKKKRTFWKQRQSWSLVELYPTDASRGRDRFFSRLKRLLEEQQIHCARLSEDEIWKRVKTRAIDRFTSATVGFIQRCRKLSHSPYQLDQLIAKRTDFSLTEWHFLEVIGPLYRAYLDRLNATGEEDFDGLMQMAANAVQSGKSIFERKSEKGDLREIRYMFIDEYQDFSELFLNLIKAVRSINGEVEFFCVGDDWQAINGFAGSDLHFYQQFKHYFSPSCKIDITTNYRSKQEIVEVGNALMKGLGKPARANKSALGRALVVDLESFTPSNREMERHNGDKITPVILRIVAKELANQRNVVLLSRKNHLPWYINYGSMAPRNKRGLDFYCDLIRSYFVEADRERITCSTTHKYKGLQQDVVIILDAVSRSYPLIHPDWIFTKPLGDNIEEIIAEEKRLFYVALTRAVDSLFIITEGESISAFLQEIQSRRELSLIAWDSFPPLQEASSRVTVRVGNLNPGNYAATYSIKDQLKASGFNWDSTHKMWQKSIADEDFSLEGLKSEPWAQNADEIAVEVAGVDNSTDANYSIYLGQWHSMDDIM